jgi:hypothetical protein
MKKYKEFKQKVDADMARLEAELARFKIRGMGFTAKAKESHDELVEQLERKIDEINDKLSEFDQVDEHLWEDLRENIENSWQVLKAALLHATETFKTESGVADAHGGDDGPFPYGKGLSGRSVGEE